MIKKERDCYQELKDKFLFDPTKSNTQDLSIDNPLSLSDNVFQLRLESMATVF